MIEGDITTPLSSKSSGQSLVIGIKMSPDIPVMASVGGRFESSCRESSDLGCDAEDIFMKPASDRNNHRKGINRDRIFCWLSKYQIWYVQWRVKVMYLKR